MVSESLCAFCQKLPVLDRKRSGKESRCPLCKAKLLTTEQGTIYRHAEDEAMHFASAPTHWWQRLGVGIFVGALAAASTAASTL